jgi:RND family efflux transporter MFP subunit
MTASTDSARRWLQPRWRRVAFYALLIVIGFALLRFTILRPREVMVVAVALRDVTGEVQGTGTVTADVLAKVGAKINGRIQRVLVNERDRVAAGQPIAVMEDTDFRREIDRAEARLQESTSRAWDAKRAWQREQQLVAKGAVSEEEADGYRSRYEVAQSAVSAAEADLRFQQFKLSETRVPSLVNGIVIKRWVNPGDAVVVGQPLFTIADPTLIYVAAYVDQRFAGKLHAGQPATVILRGREAEPIPGQVYRLSPQADPAAEELTVEVSFSLPPDRIEIGQWAEVFVQVGEVKNALVVPKAAVMPMGNDHFVFVADPGGKVRRVGVQPVTASPRLPVMAVKGDLKPGENVIIKPMGIENGQRVRGARTTPASAMPMAEGAR